MSHILTLAEDAEQSNAFSFSPAGPTRQLGTHDWPRLWPTHVALSVATDADTVDGVARREGWQCFHYNRGPFHVIEVWVENETLDLAAGIRGEYLAFTRSQGLKLEKPTSRPSN